MEASLPISAGAERTVARPAAAPASLATPAASVSLPLRFMMTGLLALMAGVIWLTVQPTVLSLYHYHQNVIAVTHLFVLGWITTVVMGAMYQLVPVALETKLYSERLAKWQFVLHVIGFAGMVWMFREWNMKQVGHFGSVLAFGVLLFIYNIVRTLLRVPRWTVVAGAVSAALAWIGLTVVLGLLMATLKTGLETETTSHSAVVAFMQRLRAAANTLSHFGAISTMHAHAHLGVVGFFTMLIVGVSYKLVPMFTLSEVQSRRRAALSIVLLNLGLAGAAGTILKNSPWRIAFGGVLVAALAVFGWEIRAILRARKRRALDWGLRHFLTALAMLIPTSVLGVILAWPGLPLTQRTGQLENVYGYLGIVGFVSLAIIGMLYKIIPFLVWFGTYSRHIGRARVPALADMYSPRLQVWSYWTFLSGLLVTSLATFWASNAMIRAGGALVLCSVFLFAVNVGLILRHYFRPQLAPLAAPKTVQKAVT